MYLEILKKYVGNNPYGEIALPAGEENIAGAEKIIGTVFPEELRALLSELDGDGYLLFSVEKIIESRNLLIDAWRDIYPDIGEYLFFAENGCGDYYGYHLKNDDKTILIWEHETGEGRRVADSLEDFITSYYEGEI